MPKQTFVYKTWLKDPAYKDWLKVCSTNTTFKCKDCEEKNKEWMLSDMRVSATKMPMPTDGHKDKRKCYQDAIAKFQQRKPVNNDDVVADNEQYATSPRPSQYFIINFMIKLDRCTFQWNLRH